MSIELWGNPRMAEKLLATDEFEEPFKNILDDLVERCGILFDELRRYFRAPYYV